MKNLKKNMYLLRWASLAGAACLVLGCSAETSSPAEQPGEETVVNSDDWGPAVDAADIEVATIKLSNGETLGWYEVAPGVLLMGGATKAGVELQTDYSKEDEEDLTPSELYEKIAAKVPQDSAGAMKALLAAEDREKALAKSMKDMNNQREIYPDAMSDSAPVASNEEGSNVRQVVQTVVDDSAYPWSEYRNYIQCQSTASWHVAWAHRTGTTWFRRGDNLSVHIGAGSYRGTIDYRIRVNTWSWETPVNVSLSPGHGWYWKKRGTVVSDFIVESKVTNASGDGYHHCGTGYR